MFLHNLFHCGYVRVFLRNPGFFRSLANGCSLTF